MARDIRYRARKILSTRWMLTATNAFVVASVALLFVLRLAPLGASAQRVLEGVDTIVMVLFVLEFVVRLAVFGRVYFLRDFGWVDLLAALPVLAPLVAVTGRLRALRIARLIRLVRIIRIVRVLRAADGSDGEHLQMKARFFLAVSSTAMLFLLATAVAITAIVDNALRDAASVNASALLDQIELVIMSTAVIAALGITATVNHYLRVLVTDRIDHVNRYVHSVLTGGNKLPMRPDDLGDEISELQVNVGRVSNVFVL
jgi:hypothetical protein